MPLLDFSPIEPQSSLLVIGAGTSRTGSCCFLISSFTDEPVGTLSTKRALQLLGYRPIHGTDMFLHRLHSMFRSALHSEEAARQFGLRLTSLGYNASLDIPFCFVAVEFARLYPEAKILLTVRDSPQSWAASFRNMTKNLLPARMFPWNYLVDLDLIYPRTNQTFLKVALLFSGAFLLDLSSFSSFDVAL